MLVLFIRTLGVFVISTRDRYIERANRVNVIVRNILFVCAILSIFVTVGIVFSLIFNTFVFFRQVSVVEFFTAKEWTPLFINPVYGVLPLVLGTLIVTVISTFIAVPLGIASAIYLSEYAPKIVKKILKPALEVLAGVPSIVYGYFALNFITPYLQKWLPQTEIYNAASASIALGIMIMPMISSLSEDALSVVPKGMKYGGFALGLTKLEVVSGISLRHAFPGIVSAIVLAVSRAIGETMIVTIAAGAKPSLTLNPLGSVQTLTAFIAQVSQGDTPHGTTSYYALYAVGMLLFLLTFIMNIIAHRIILKNRRLSKGG